MCASNYQLDLTRRAPAVGPTSDTFVLESTVILEHSREDREQPALLPVLRRLLGHCDEVELQTLLHLRDRNPPFLVQRFTLSHVHQQLVAALAQQAVDLLLGI